MLTLLLLLELQSEKVQTETQLITVKRDLSILLDKEEEYAKQAYFKTKEIKALRERVELLEKQQLVTAEKFKQSTKEYKIKVSKELNQATFDSAGLRQLLRTKNRELRQMKTLAATILRYHHHDYYQYHNYHPNYHHY